MRLPRFLLNDGHELPAVGLGTFGMTSEDGVATILAGWHLQLDLLPIPRSTDPQRQRRNLEIDGAQLTTDEVAAISALGRRGGRLWNGDPETTGFM